MDSLETLKWKDADCGKEVSILITEKATNQILITLFLKTFYESTDVLKTLIAELRNAGVLNLHGLAASVGQHLKTTSLALWVAAIQHDTGVQDRKGILGALASFGVDDRVVKLRFHEDVTPNITEKLTSLWLSGGSMEEHILEYVTVADSGEIWLEKRRSCRPSASLLILVGGRNSCQCSVPVFLASKCVFVGPFFAVPVLLASKCVFVGPFFCSASLACGCSFLL